LGFIDAGIIGSEIILSEAQRGQAIMQFDYAQMKRILPKQKSSGDGAR